MPKCRFVKMVGVSIVAAIQSFINYFQNLALQIELPKIPVPEKLRDFLNFISNFLSSLFSLIPSLPPFDIRAQLVIVSLIFPLLIDIFFVWFITPILSTLLHLIDLVASFFALYFASKLVLDGKSVVNYILTALPALFLFVRFIYVRIKRSKNKLTVADIAFHICNYHLAGIVPKIESTISIEHLNQAILRFSNAIKIVPPSPSFWPPVFIITAGFILLFFGLNFLGVIPIKIFVSSTVARILSPILLAISAFCFILFVLKVTLCGQKFIRGFKLFTQRWGLRLLMLALDLLYIPILSIFLDLMVPKNVSCGENQYLYVNYTERSLESLFLIHNATCTPCSFPHPGTDFCNRMCGGGSTLRVSSDASLRYIEDVLIVDGGIFIYAVFVVMIGIPLLWHYVIKTNQRVVYIINAYGKTAEEKWLTLLSRLKSTGIFLFAPYKFNRSTWSVYVIVFKFAIMVVTQLSARVFKWGVYILPAVYIIMLINTLHKTPYLQPANTFIDSVLYLFNLIFTSMPILAEVGVSMPSKFVLALTICIFILPFVSLILFVFCKKRSPGLEEADFTVVQKLSEGEIHRRSKLLKKAKRRTLKQRRDGFIPMNIEPIDVFIKEEDLSGDRRLEDAIEEYEFPEDTIGVDYSELQSIVEVASEHKSSFVISPEERYRLNAFTCNKRTIAKRITEMYKMLDIVLDGHTIELLTSVLNGATVFGAMVAGWYFGSLQEMLPTDTELMC